MRRNTREMLFECESENISDKYSPPPLVYLSESADRQQQLVPASAT